MLDLECEFDGDDRDTMKQYKQQIDDPRARVSYRVCVCCGLEASDGENESGSVARSNTPEKQPRPARASQDPSPSFSRTSHKSH